jgi:hypothetical protein
MMLAVASAPPGALLHLLHLLTPPQASTPSGQQFAANSMFDTPMVTTLTCLL